MLLTKKSIIIILCVIVLLLVISIGFNIISNTIKNNNNISNNAINKEISKEISKEINKEINKEKFAFVTDPKYAFLGCFNDINSGNDQVSRALPNLLAKSPSMNTPEACYNLANTSYDTFGLQNGNECWASNSNDTTSPKPDKAGSGTASLCTGNFGGAMTNQVYKIKPTFTKTTKNELYTQVYKDKYDVWQVPEGVTQATFTVTGGSGYGYNNEIDNNINLGGGGAKVTALVTGLIPGDIYDIYVGGNAIGFKGGINGFKDENDVSGYYGSDGTGSPGAYKGGGGGAATCVYNFMTPIIIAGGGGGCPNISPTITNSKNTGGSAGINKNGDGGAGDAPIGVTPPQGGKGGLTITGNSTFGQINNNANNSGGAGGGSNGGKVGGVNTSGGAGGSYVNPIKCPNYSFVTSSSGVPSVLIDWSNQDYIYKGCYIDKTQHALPVLLSTKQKVSSVSECYNLAKYNYDVFALQNGGECWAGNLAKDDYTKYDQANNCAILGNRLVNQVYEIYKAPTTTSPNAFETSPNYEYKGCFKDKIKEPALPQYYDMPAYSVEDCYNLAKENSDYDIFALQFGGECWAGNSVNDSYQKYGEVPSGCSILGNAVKNQVYQIKRQPTTTQGPTTTKAPTRVRPPSRTTIPMITDSETAYFPEIATNLVNAQTILNNLKKM